MDYEMKDCAGCSTCSIACSFRHMNEFNPEFASIEIIENVDKPGYFVRLHKEGANQRIPCDGCVEVDGEPICVLYCPKKIKLMEIIEDFRKHIIYNSGRRE